MVLFVLQREQADLIFHFFVGDTVGSSVSKLKYEWCNGHQSMIDMQSND